jgi:glyoxylase-like metal-dependent hydrolase (beta-lactamase superfamily II)
MGNGTLRFEIGKFECTVVSDGSITVPNGQVMDLMSLLIRTGEHSVLIDTGMGIGNEATAGKLLDNLQTAGIKTGEIDKVIISHAHIDHVGANVDSTGKPNFPNARYVISKKEWDYWVPRLQLKPGQESKSEASHIAAGRKNILPITGQFDIVEGEKEIVPGIKFELAPGHTPGNTMVVVSSGGKQLLCVGDVIHDPLELTKPGIWAEWDVSPEETNAIRAQILSRAAASNSLLFICHFPFPGLGFVVKKGAHFAWQPSN